MLHQEAHLISYRHHYEINKFTKDILGLFGVEHFSLDLVDESGKMLFFSSTPSHAYEICSRGLARYDGIISPLYYESLNFYWWKTACHKAYSEKINYIRENILNLKDGFMLVRKIEKFRLIYSFATKKDICFKNSVEENKDDFLKLGDYIYSNLQKTYSLYCENPTPKLVNFIPYQEL